MAKKKTDLPSLQPREFRSSDEIDLAIAKLSRRVQELEQLDVRADVLDTTGAVAVAESNLRETLFDVFGENSPEFKEHGNITIWGGGYFFGMTHADIIAAKDEGRRYALAIVKGLVGRLQEKRADLTTGFSPAPSTYFDRLKLHPRIRDVSRDLFFDGHHWDAVFAAAKTLINYVKEKSGRHDLDGAPLVRTVFSSKNPVLAFNALNDQTDHDEQEGMMHLFEGAVLAIRNPGGHSFPEGPEQWAIEYISFLSLLAYRLQEARKVKS